MRRHHVATPARPALFDLRDDLAQLERWQRLDQARKRALIALVWIVTMSLSVLALTATAALIVWMVR